MKKLSKKELMAKAYSFLSYLLREEFEKIKHIYLFGSVARGDYDETSDIDLFIEVEPNDEKPIEKKVGRALARFSRIEGEKWRLRGLSQQIIPQVGALQEWQLKTSIEREGIVLYSPTFHSNLEKFLLFTLSTIRPVKKRIRVIRALFGRRESGYKDEGLIHKFKGNLLDPRTFVVSASGLHEITSYLAKEKVQFRFEEIWK